MSGFIVGEVRTQATLFPINGVRVKTKRFKPTLYMSKPDIAAFLEAATWQALRRLTSATVYAKSEIRDIQQSTRNQILFEQYYPL